MSRKQVVNDLYQDFLKQSVKEGLVACYSENDITLSPTPISSGSIRTYNAELKCSGTGTPVLIKSVVNGCYNCTKELRID
ncbi:2073_t:CDS:2 [Paraglomus occultum]|uniref:2073_t:CDS:1 n=1 Tax=Paraglomus occultum TaxID=144539 RepID=A0A9N9F2V2_9GLOM|nr:2073_t:CDS:2 [Paraglomus occultum]